MKTSFKMAHIADISNNKISPKVNSDILLGNLDIKTNKITPLYPSEKIGYSNTTMKTSYLPGFEKHFGCYENALEYASKIVVRALQGNNPYEHFVAIDSQGKVLFEVKGNKRGISIPPHNKRLLVENTFLIHGHPGEVPYPISFMDFYSLNDFKSKEITAFNKSGQFSKLKKGDNFVQLSQKKKDEYLDKYIKEVLTFWGDDSVNIQKIHEFWKRHSSDLGLIYETNYSGLL